MSKYVVDIHGFIKGDSDLVSKIVTCKDCRYSGEICTGNYLCDRLIKYGCYIDFESNHYCAMGKSREK